MGLMRVEPPHQIIDMKRYNKKGKITKQEFAHMWSVAQMNCCNCHAFSVQVHHITEGFRRLGSMYVLPLCPSCHARVDSKGFAWEMEKCKEIYKKLGLEWVEPVSKVVKRLD